MKKKDVTKFKKKIEKEIQKEGLSEEVILKALTDFNGLTNAEISELLGVKSLDRRLKRLVNDGKIIFKKIPTVRTVTRYKFFHGYQGVRVFSVDEEHFITWIRSHMPKKVSPAIRKTLGYIIHQLGCKIELPPVTYKKQLWIYNIDLYEKLEEIAKKEQSSVSQIAENLMKTALGIEITISYEVEPIDIEYDDEELDVATIETG